MKLAHKIFIFTLGCGLVTSCADLDTYPEGGTFTADQKTATAAALPERLSADVKIGRASCRERV